MKKNIYVVNMFSSHHHTEKTFLNSRGKLIDIRKPKIMGILNITPDSFSDGGKFNDEKKALLRVEKMIKEGSEILDIGAQSTRPKANLISPKEEILRLGRIISTIRKEFPKMLISLDTFYSEVVKFGFDEGIDWVNDISGGQYDPEMFKTIAEKKLVYILTHSNSSYKELHQRKSHEDIILELNRYFFEKIEKLIGLGAKDIIIDPGFGFGKTFEDQRLLLDQIKYIVFGRYPILIGISRKSFIYKGLRREPLNIILETAILHYKALEQGVKIFRVHDVSEMKRVFDFHDFLKI